jgi:hypothetical protein
MWTAVGAPEALGRALEGPHPPVADFVEVDVERGLVELNDVDAGGLDLARFGVQDFRERPRELFAASIVAVVERVDHRHRAGQRDLDLALRRVAQEPRRLDEHRAAPGDRSDHHRHGGVVAVADPHGLPVLEVDAIEGFQECRHEVAAGLFAIGDDIDARLLLVPEHQPDRVIDAFGEDVALEPPGSP